jgi:hypothetical protein
MSAILISDPASLREAIGFAIDNNCVEQLGVGLVRLFQTLTVGMTKDNNRVAQVLKDFAPHSLGFAIFDNVRISFEEKPSRCNFLMNGGWIYAGPGSPGDGSAPAFSVNLDYVAGHAPKHSWSVHT